MLARQRLLSLAALALFTACQTAQPERPVVAPVALKPLKDIDGLVGTVPKPGYARVLVTQFRDMTFQDDMRVQFGVLTRWRTDREIRVCLDASTQNTHIGKLAEAERLLSEITGLRFTNTGSCDVTVARSNVARANDDIGYCYADGRWQTATGILLRSEIYIPDHQRLAGDCLIEELAQSLGFFADSSVVGSSLFQESDLMRTVTTLTWSDAVQLRTLYDPRLRPGMPKDEAMKIVPVIIEEHLRALNR